MKKAIIAIVIGLVIVAMVISSIEFPPCTSPIIKFEMNGANIIKTTKPIKPIIFINLEAIL